MSEFSPARRQLILNAGVILGGGVAVLAGATVARGAMQAQTLAPSSALGIAVANRCKVSSDHAAIRAQLLQELAADPALTTLSERCPICGCPIVVTR